MRFGLVACLFFSFLACNLSPKKEVPHLYVQNFDSALKKVEGSWYYKNEKLNGYIIETNKTDKTILYQVPIIDGLEEGQAFGKYNSGEKLLTRNYRKGKIEGTFTQWWPNGNYRYLFNYKNDVMDGKQMVYYPNGQKHQESNFLEGNEEGIQRVWNESGQLISNYTIKNKKLYGVISVKSCLPEGHH